MRHAVIVAGPLSSEAQSFGLSAILLCCYASYSRLVPAVNLCELKSDKSKPGFFLRRYGTTVFMIFGN